MVQYDDTAADESVRVFDRGMEFKEPENFGEHQLSYRSGDIVVPRVEAAEPLSLELQDFARAIHTGAMPRSHAQLGLETVAAIEAAETSLRLRRRAGRARALARAGRCLSRRRREGGTARRGHCGRSGSCEGAR